MWSVEPCLPKSTASLSASVTAFPSLLASPRLDGETFFRVVLEQLHLSEHVLKLRLHVVCTGQFVDDLLHLVALEIHLFQVLFLEGCDDFLHFRVRHFVG